MKDKIERFLIHLHRYFLNELIEKKTFIQFLRDYILFTYQHVMVDFFQFEPDKKKKKKIIFFNSIEIDDRFSMCTIRTWTVNILIEKFNFKI